MGHANTDHSLRERKPTKENVRNHDGTNGRTSLSCQELERIIWATRDAVITIDEDRKIRLFNPAAEQMFRCSAREAIGQPVEQLVPQRFRDAYNKDVRAIGKSKPATRMMGDLGSAKGLRADGEEFPIEALISRLSTDGKMLVMVMIRDLTERNLAEQRLREQQSSLRTLAAQLWVAEERERHRIARGLHDDLGQTLTVAKLTVSELLNSQSEGNVSSQLRDLSVLLNQAIQATRSLTFELGSSLLYELGLEAALEGLGEQFEKRHNIRFTFDTDHQVPALSEETNTVLFRIVRELLFNIEKHAHAQHVCVSIRRVGEEVCIAVHDDGMGFDPCSPGKGLHPSGGFGLHSISVQGNSIGGRVDIESQPGRGTHVVVHAPLT
jgi:two-component system sensor kinase